ncbi:MAG: hypothetical protein MSA89_11945 [Clostridium sp.]|nr:hypothetical protein [Clostridium sp.]
MNKTICGILVIIGIIASLVVPIEATTATKEFLIIKPKSKYRILCRICSRDINIFRNI